MRRDNSAQSFPSPLYSPRRVCLFEPRLPTAVHRGTCCCITVEQGAGCSTVVYPGSVVGRRSSIARCIPPWVYTSLYSLPGCTLPCCTGITLPVYPCCTGITLPGYLCVRVATLRRVVSLLWRNGGNSAQSLFCSLRKEPVSY